MSPVNGSVDQWKDWDLQNPGITLPQVCNAPFGSLHKLSMFLLTLYVCIYMYVYIYMSFSVICIIP